MRSFLATIVLCSLSIALAPVSANAATFVGDSDDEYGKERMDDRLIRIEKALNTLEKSVYKGNPSARDSSTMQPFEQEVAANGGGNNIEIRLNDIERKLRELTGLIEEFGYSNRTGQEKLNNFVDEVNWRLTQLEKAAGIESKSSFSGNAAATTTSPTPAPVTTNSKSTTVIDFTAPPADGLDKSDGTRELGTIPAEKATLEPENTFGPQYDYDQAFGLLRQSKYQPAADAFRSFIDKYPKHELISAAYYWLGETSYVQKDFEQASVAFLQGYQNNTKGDKAPDSLFKLAMSLKEMSKKKEACATFAKLNKEFSGTISATLKKKADEESSKIGCKK